MGEKTFLAQTLWERLKTDQWPLEVQDFPIGTALVGGALRDVLLKRSSQRRDLDFVVPSNAVNLTRSLAEKLVGTCVVLDEDRDIARLIVSGWTIDVASQVGESLEIDLWNRDFTLNAIALTFHPRPQIFDPTGGLKDLKQKRLSAVRETNLIADPLRLLRGLRLMAELRLSLDSQTKTWIQIHAKLLDQAAPERIQSEIKRLICAPWADEVMPILKSIGLLNLWKNSGNGFKKKAPSLRDAKLLSDSEASKALPLARLVHLLSDAGLNELRFSRKQRQSCQLLRKWQMRNDGMAFQNLKEEERLELHKELESDLPALILGLSNEQQSNWLSRWRNPNDPLFHPASPLDGHTLQMIFDLPSGPKLGSLISHLCKERAFDRVQNREEALQVARYWLVQK